MKTKMILFTVILVSLLGGGVGCEPETGYLLETSLSFRYVNGDGSDILNSESQIKLYYLINGDTIEAKDVLPDNLDNRNGFSLLRHEKEYFYYVHLIVNPFDIQKENSITFIQFDDNPLDVIKCEHKKGRGYHVISKAWYNNELIWDLDSVDMSDIGYWLIKIKK